MKNLLLFIIVPFFASGQMLKDSTTGKFSFSGTINIQNTSSENLYERGVLAVAGLKYKVVDQNKTARKITANAFYRVHCPLPQDEYYKVQLSYVLHLKFENNICKYEITDLYFESDKPKKSVEETWDESQNFKNRERKQISELFSNSYSIIENDIIKIKNGMGIPVVKIPVTALDSTNSRLDKIENSINFMSTQLKKCHSEYQVGIILWLTGSVGLICSPFITSENGNTHNGILIASSVLTLAGVILEIDAHRFIGKAGQIHIGPTGLTYYTTLNFNHKKSDLNY